MLIMIPSKRLNSPIWPINETLTGTTILGQSGHENNVNEEVLHIPQTPRLEPHHQMQFSVIPRILNGFKTCYLTLIILFKIIHLFAHS